METRTVKELLQVMLDNKHYFKRYLCLLVSDLYYVHHKITHIEVDVLIEYINTNRPSKYDSYDAFCNRKYRYYWTPGNIKPRIKWMKQHINKLSNEN